MFIVRFCPVAWAGGADDTAICGHQDAVNPSHRQGQPKSGCKMRVLIDFVTTAQDGLS
jgi:hypothetical protein